MKLNGRLSEIADSITANNQIKHTNRFSKTKTAHEKPKILQARAEIREEEKKLYI